MATSKRQIAAIAGAFLGCTFLVYGNPPPCCTLEFAPCEGECGADSGVKTCEAGNNTTVAPLNQGGTERTARCYEFLSPSPSDWKRFSCGSSQGGYIPIPNCEVDGTDPALCCYVANTVSPLVTSQFFSVYTCDGPQCGE